MKILKKQNQIPNGFLSAAKKRFDGSMQAHGHDFFELEYIVDGHGIYEIDGIAYSIEKNTLFLMTPANVHALYDTEIELINVMFSGEYRGEAFSLLHPHAYSSCFRLNEKQAAMISSLLHELVAVQKTDLHYETLLLQCVLQKLLHVKASRERELLPYIQHAILYILENFRTGVTLENIALHLGLSQAYLSDLFKKEMGMTFKAYLDDLRFSYVKNLLRSTNLSVREIYDASGFHDYSNFARRFKIQFGVTPTEYRRTARER